MVQKKLFIDSAISALVKICFPSIFNEEMLVVLDFLFKTSLIVFHVLLRSPSQEAILFLKYSRLSFSLVYLLDFIYFERIACFFNLSLVLHIGLKSLVKQGENLSESRLLRVRTCFSRIREKILVQVSTITLMSFVFLTIPLQSTP